jgi:ankyrin repeat protein
MANGYAALSTAIRRECPDTVVKLLLRAKADVNCTSARTTTTVLHHAAIQGRRGTVDLLVRAKADVLAKTASGHTAASLARAHKHFKLAAYFEAVAGL